MNMSKAIRINDFCVLLGQKIIQILVESTCAVNQNGKLVRIIAVRYVVDEIALACDIIILQ